MDKELSMRDYAHFERVLRERLNALRGEVLDKLAHAESYAQIAGEVRDAEEEALADLLEDVSLVGITNAQEEARDIDQALRRVLARSYGLCLDCRELIDRGRLEAYPTAKRCLACQQARDRARMSPPPPTL